MINDTIAGINIVCGLAAMIIMIFTKDSITGILGLYCLITGYGLMKSKIG